MARDLIEEDFTLIIDALAKFPTGGTLDEITTSLERPILRRTLQRRLMILVKEGRVVAEGKTRARKYLIVPKQLNIKSLTNRQEQGFIPLSIEAIRIQTLVTGPIESRQHVSYNRDFLESYRPNSTYYLSESLRKDLFEMGKSPDGKRPAGTYAHQIFNRLLIDLSWNSSRLEGNTYSILETERLLQFNEPSEGKDLKEAQMILNHKAAIEFLVESAEDIGINKFTILNLHALLSNNLLSDPSACGRLRSIPVGIAKTVYIPLLVSQLIEEHFDKLINLASEITDPFEQSFFLMVHIPYLQSFEDVNKRVSRLAANIPLIRENLSPLSFVDVPEEIYITGLLGIYELNQIELMRDIFVWAYQRSCSLYSATRKALGEPDPFRLRYSEAIRKAIKNIIWLRMDKKSALAFIEREKGSLPQGDQKKFIEVVERELLALHEGNIARYRLHLKEYEEWRSVFN